MDLWLCIGTRLLIGCCFDVDSLGICHPAARVLSARLQQKKVSLLTVFCGSKAPMPTLGYYVRMPVVCMTLACVCIDMYVGRGPMIILYASIRLCIYDLYVGGAR